MDERGWHFATAANSPKAYQIVANPNVAIKHVAFYWPPLGRQVRVRGNASLANDNERDADFKACSVEAKANVFVGRQSQPLRSRQELREIIAAQVLRVTESPDDLAENWARFIVEPYKVEFWQATTDRRHYRLSYTHDAAGWPREELWP